MLDVLSDDIKASFWIDGMQRQIKLRRLAIPEVMEYINALSDTNNETINETATLFLLLNVRYTSYKEKLIMIILIFLIMLRKI